MAGKLVCLSMQWLIIWRQFYTAQSQFRIHSAPNEAGPRVFFFVNIVGNQSAQNCVHMQPLLTTLFNEGHQRAATISSETL